MRWVKVTPYDIEQDNNGTQSIWINADHIEMMQEGNPYKNVTPPTKIPLGGDSVRVIETPAMILSEIHSVFNIQTVKGEEK